MKTQESRVLGEWLNEEIIFIHSNDTVSGESAGTGV